MFPLQIAEHPIPALFLTGQLLLQPNQLEVLIHLHLLPQTVQLSFLPQVLLLQELQAALVICPQLLILSAQFNHLTL